MCESENLVLHLQCTANDVQDFIPRLKDHLLARQNNIPYDGDEHAFSDEQRDSITFVGNRMYKHDVIRVNYTTYDMRRAQDSINVRTHPYLMTLAHEDEEEGTTWHPYWYAKVLGIFHVVVRRSGYMETERMEFLWVHWFGRDPDHEGGFDSRRLYCIGLTDGEDPTSYGFLDPSDVLRSVHLIPAFSPNQIDQEMVDSDDDAIPQFHYYISMCVTVISESIFTHTETERLLGLSIVTCSCDFWVEELDTKRLIIWSKEHPVAFATKNPIFAMKTSSRTTQKITLKTKMTQ
jgi:hypothetical protein